VEGKTVTPLRQAVEEHRFGIGRNH